MKDNGYVRMQLTCGKFEVLVSKNKVQWNVVYEHKEIELADIIEKAYIDVGYKQLTHEY